MSNQTLVGLLPPERIAEALMRNPKYSQATKAVLERMRAIAELKKRIRPVVKDPESKQKRRKLWTN